MNRYRWLKIASGLVFAHLLQSASAEVAASKHRATLDRFGSDYIAAMVDGKPDPILRYASEKLRVMPEYHGTLFGKDNARAYHLALFERVDIQKYAREPLRTYDFGPRVIELGRFTMSVQPGHMGQSHELQGKYIEIWESANGKLTLITQGWNYDHYPEIANQLRFTNVPAVRTAFEAHVPINGGLSFELAALNKLQEVAIVQHDDKVWAQFYADDALLMINHSTVVEGKAAIRDYLARHTREMPVFEKLDIRHDYIDPVGEHIIDYASHVANWRNGDSSGVNTGKNVRIWRREPDGSLKMICQIGMYD